MYEGLDESYTTTLPADSSSSFKIRVKRDPINTPLNHDIITTHKNDDVIAAREIPPSYGPFSQTVTLKMRGSAAGAGGNNTTANKAYLESDSKVGTTELEVEEVSDDRYIVVFILLALCLPAVLAIFYFVSF